MQNILSAVERSFVMPPPSSEPYFGHQMASWRQDFSNGNQQVALVMNSMSSNAVVADARRIQGMETTIQYLKELLAREIANKFDREDYVKLKIELEASYSANSMIRQGFEEDIKKLRLDLNTSNMTKEALKKELVEAIQDKDTFKDQLKNSLDEWNSAEAQLLAFKNEYQNTSAELVALKSELAELREKLAEAKRDVKNLEVVNKIAEEESRDLVEQIKILKAEKECTSVVECSCTCQNTTMQYSCKSSLKLENKLLKEENDLMKSQLESAISVREANEELTKQLDQTISQLPQDGRDNCYYSKTFDLDSESGTSLPKQFQELAKKYMYVIAQCEREEYLALQERTNEFLKALEMERQFTKDPVKSTLIHQMSETVLSQRNVINDCLEELEFYLDLMIEDIDAGTVLVSDLNLRIRQPRFEIPPDDYEQMLNLVSKVGVEDKQTI